MEVDLRRHERPDVKRLQELEAESRRSKEFVAEQALDIDMLRDLAEGNCSPGTAGEARCTACASCLGYLSVECAGLRTRQLHLAVRIHEAHLQH